jgi:rRNA processing protein Krr1/Pno1
MMPRGRRNSVEKNNNDTKKEKEKHCQEECEVDQTTLVATMLRGEMGTPLSNTTLRKGGAQANQTH